MSERDLRSQLAPAYDEAEIADAWRGIAARRARPRRRWIVLAVPAFALAAAAVVAIVLWRGGTTPGSAGALTTSAPVSIEAGAQLEAGPQPLALDDGSQLQIAPRSKVSVLANDGERFSMLLERGTIEVAVKPGGPRRWEIETALATVEVVGTVFTVAHDEHSLTVAVDRGVVMVRGERVKGRVQRLTAGMRLVVEDRVITADVTPPIAPAPVPATPVPVETTEPAPTPPPPAPVAPPAKALAPAVAPAPAPRIANAIFEADKLRATDAAAAAKHLEDALAATPDDPSAGLARFTLGRLYLDSGEPAKAVPLFRAIIARGSPHTLLEDAHARLVEALVKSGDATGAKAAFGEYERLYPQGRRLARLRAML